MFNPVAMRAKTRRRLTGVVGVVLCLVAAVVLLAGCGPASAPEGRLTYWRTLTGPAGRAQDELARRFNASRTDGVHVVAEFQGNYGELAAKIKTAAVAGTGPEVTQLGTFEIREFARAGLLVDLRPYLDGPNGLDTTGWPETFLSAGEVDGGLYWLPFNVTAPILYYNQEAFAEAGLPGPPETWDAFFEYARRLTVRTEAGRVTRAGVALWDIAWPLVSAIWSEGGRMNTPDYREITLDHPVVVEVLESFAGLVRDGAATLPDRASGGHRAAFKSGRAAMILDSPAPMAEIIGQAYGFTPGIALYPAGKAGRVYAPGGGGLAMLAVTPENKRDAAWAFIRFMLAPENLAYYARESGFVAFTEDARRAAGAWIQAEPQRTIHEAVDYVRADFSLTAAPALRTAFDEAFQAIMVNQADVRTTLARAGSRARATLAEGQAGAAD